MFDTTLFKAIPNEFNTRDRVLLASIACSLLGVVTGLVLLPIPAWQEFGDLLLNSAQTIGEWTGLVLLIMNGTTRKTRYWQFIIAAILILAMSWVFSVLHLPGNDELLLGGFILLDAVYTVRFITRKLTGILDWLKYLWICSWCVAIVLLTFHKVPPAFILIPSILFWITIVFFVLIRLKLIKEVKGNY
jgi:hypothetical protein